eukprot:1142679-Pelagomonas_calceolata.AAC.3
MHSVASCSHGAQHSLVAQQLELLLGIVHVSQATAHAGPKVLAGLAQDDCDTTRHVLTRVVTHALHHGSRSRVAHAEALCSLYGVSH